MPNSIAILIIVFLIAIDSLKSHETTCSTCREKYKGLFADMLERVKRIESHNTLEQLYTTEKGEILQHLETISKLVNDANKDDKTPYFWFLKSKKSNQSQSEFLKTIEKLNEEVQGHINQLFNIVNVPRKGYYQPSTIGETYQIIFDLSEIIKTLDEQLLQKTKNTIDRSHARGITIHVCFDGCWRTLGKPENGLIEGKRFSGPAANNLSAVGHVFGENVSDLCMELNKKQKIEEEIVKEENKKGNNENSHKKHTPQIEKKLEIESVSQFCSILLQKHLDEVDEHHPSKRIFKEYPIGHRTITHIGSAVSNPDNIFGKFHSNHSTAQEVEKSAVKVKTESQEIKNGEEKVKAETQGPLLQRLYSAANFVGGFGFGGSANKGTEHGN